MEKLSNTIQSVNVMTDLDAITCECGCRTFSERFVFKKVPGAIAGQIVGNTGGRSVALPLPVYRCDGCGRTYTEDDFIRMAQEVKPAKPKLITE